jgi:predicted HTH transcriptional regulator
MSSILISLIILFAAAVFGLVVWAWKDAKKHNTSASEEFIGICKSAIETASQKEGRKQKALVMIQEKDAVSNFEIRKALGVSSRTAVRYLDELEREGKGKAAREGNWVNWKRLEL